jgi:DNA-binding Lrp family transcriptional regulator
MQNSIIGRISEVSGKSVKLDVKDKKILYLLSHDGRMQLSKIAEEIRLSKDAVRYRLKQLRQKGVILKYSPMIDLTHIGYYTYHVLLLVEEKNKEE